MLAHNVGGGALPAPPWLLAYLGAALVLATAVVLRTTWMAPRLSPTGGRPDADPRLHVGHGLGIALLAAALAAAIIGPDSAAANVAPVAVLVVWWVGLPLLCLLVGDLHRAINPFVGLVLLLRRGSTPTASPPPVWVPAAFLASFSWYFLAYHRPGSPRSLALFLGAYTVAAVAAGLRWGPAWLATGEGFGALSSSVARIGLRRPPGPVPAGTLAVAVVWLGGTAFDAFANVPFWTDVLGTSAGWVRTGLNTLGLVWLTAMVGGAALAVLRAADLRADEEAPAARASLIPVVGWALVPLATGWFLAHDLTLLLFEGQNFYALVSDPLGRGWDLFGTFDHTIDYGIVEATWVRWVQVALLAVGHAAAVVLFHDGALRVRGRRDAMRATWVMAVAGAGSIVGAALLVLG